MVEVALHAGATDSHAPRGLGGVQAWPLVGRELELAQIVAGQKAAACPGMVLTAPAGIGKSRLAREAVASAARGGAMVGWVQATRSAATVPLGACAGLLPEDARSDDPLELLQASADALRVRAAGRPIVLGVDDAQRLDQASAALVLHLTMTGTAFVLATVRSSESCPDAVTSLWKDAGAERMELGPLSESKTAELIEAVLAGPVEQRARRWIYDSTQGNVLYVHELISAALAESAFANVDGLWVLTRRPRPSASLSELVGERLAELDAEERRAIELLALGEPLRLSELVSLTGERATSSVEARELVRVAGANAAASVGLAHPLYGDVVRASMPVIRAAEIRRLLAETVQARPDRSREDALMIARWLLDAGDPVPPELLVEAAAAALPAGDPELGERLARMALETGAGGEAAMLAARAYAVRQRFEEAEAVLAPFEGMLDTQQLAIAYVQQRATVLLWGLQRAHDGLELVERAREWWDEPAWWRELAPIRIRMTAMTTDFRSAAELSQEALADDALELAARRRMELVHATNLFYGGRIREAHELIARLLPSVPLRSEADESAMIMASVIGLESGWETDEVEAWMRLAVTDGVRVNDHAATGIGAVTLGGLGMLRGRYTDAARWLKEAVVHLEYHDPFGTLKYAHALLAGVACYTGDASAAVTAMERCDAATSGEAPDTGRSYIARGKAWLALAQGDPPRAQQLLLDSADSLHKVPLYAAQLYHDALRAGAPARRVRERLETLRELCDGRLPIAYMDDAAARAARDGVAVLACADEFEAIGAERYACECAAAAAEIFADAGRQDSARRAAARSRELHQRGQGGFAPSIRGLGRDAVTLTPREAQLVELASRGLTNSEIAEQLVVSVRTVESHIYHAMQKLGVSDRREL